MADKKPVWKDPRGIARAAVVGLFVDLACYALSVLGWVFTLDAMSGVIPEPLSDGGLTLNELSSVLVLLSYVVVGVIVLMWIYRVCVNAHTLTHGMESSAWGAVLWYFVPIAYLWKPFSSLAEIWRVSESPEKWRVIDPPPLMRWWWGLWLARAFTGYAAFQVQRLAAGSTNGDPGAILSIISEVAMIGAILAMIAIIRRLTANQILAHEQNVFD